MRLFDTAFAAELDATELTVFYCVYFGFSTVYRYTDFDIPVIHDGARYEPHNIKFDSFVMTAAGTVEYLELEIDNAAQDIGVILLTDDCRNKEAIFYAGLKYQDRTTACQEIFRGLVSEWEIGEKVCKITIANEFILWRKKPLRIAQVSCPWVFKDTETCRYTGTESKCGDQSYDRCLALGNNLNFGGFRFLPDTSEKTIWWGRTPD